MSGLVPVQFQFSGPKDRQLVAGPALRGGRGRCDRYLSAEGAPRFVPALRASELEKQSSPPSRTGY
jgi:hypothetical protein